MKRVTAAMSVAVGAFVLAACGSVAAPGRASPVTPAPSPTSTRPGATPVDVAASVLEALGRLHEPLPSASTSEEEPNGAAVPTRSHGRAGAIERLIAPGPCDLATGSEPGHETACGAGLLWSGSAGDREFVALVAFDLAPIAPDVTLEAARLTMTGLDGQFLRPGGTWRLSQVELPPDTQVAGLSLARMLELPEPRHPAAWTLGSGDLGPGAVNDLTFDRTGLLRLQERVGAGRAVFRIEGPSGGANLVAWGGWGCGAPTLHLALGDRP